MHPDAKKAAKDAYLKVLQSNCLPEHTDLDDLADQLTNASSWNDVSDDYSVSICHLTHHPPSIPLKIDSPKDCETDTGRITACMEHPDLSIEIQPVRFPDHTSCVCYHRV